MSRSRWQCGWWASIITCRTKWNGLSRRIFTTKRAERLWLKSWQTLNKQRNFWSRWTLHCCPCRWIPKNMSAKQNSSLSCTSMSRERTRSSRKRSRLLRLRFLNRGRCPCLTSWSRSRNRKSSQPSQRLRNPKRMRLLLMKRPRSRRCSPCRWMPPTSIMR